MPNQMTDEEILCTWMERRPAYTISATLTDGTDLPKWWEIGSEWEWVPIKLTLIELWEIQDRLSDEQWEVYYHNLGKYSNGGLVWNTPDRQFRWALHATPTQKIAALAAVLRSEVEGRTK